MTWVNMVGLEKARELAKQHTNSALASIAHAGGDNQFLLDLFDYMLCREF